VLAGVLLKLGGYGFFRFFSFLRVNVMGRLGTFLAWGLIGGLLSCFLCLRQSDLKAFVAYSSVCHIGLGLGGLFSSSFYGVGGGVYMLVGHGFCSSCLFYLLYVLYERFRSRSVMMLKGLIFLRPILVFFIFLFGVLNMGVPPSLSFFSEVLSFSGLLGFHFRLILVGFFFLFLAGVYGIFFYAFMCHGLSVFEGLLGHLSIREFLLGFGHFFPLFYVPFFIGVLFTF
jgi:NADH:ubiquinone oxidoreductase subunit 4 (subunit M)